MTRILEYLPTVAKGIAAGIVAGIGAGATAAVDDRITTGEWWTVAAAAAAAAAITWGIPNKD